MKLYRTEEGTAMVTLLISYFKSNGYNVYSRHLKMLDINKWREWPFEIMWQRVDKLNSTTENFAKHSLH